MMENNKGKHSNKVADNRFVVPYNPYSLLKFNFHINVEVCSTVQCIKYLFKYYYNGHDCAFIEINNIDLNLKDDNNSSNGKDNTQNHEYDYDELNNILVQDIYAHQKLCIDCCNMYYMKHHIL